MRLDKLFYANETVVFNISFPPYYNYIITAEKYTCFFFKIKISKMA